MEALVNCEYSGVMRDKLEDRGIDAWSCDLEDTESHQTKRSGKHIIGDAVYVAYEFSWVFMMAHPPCTYLTISQAWTYKYPDRFPGRERYRDEAIRFFKLLWEAPIPLIGIENPVPMSQLTKEVGKYSQIVQPYQFGDDASKRTCLWLKGLPYLEHTDYVEPRIFNGKSRWGNQTDGGWNKLGPSKTRSKDRSRTYEGIAEAIADQWSPVIKSYRS